MYFKYIDQLEQELTANKVGKQLEACLGVVNYLLEDGDQMELFYASVKQYGTNAQVAQLLGSYEQFLPEHFAESNQVALESVGKFIVDFFKAIWKYLLNLWERFKNFFRSREKMKEKLETQIHENEMTIRKMETELKKEGGHFGGNEFRRQSSLYKGPKLFSVKDFDRAVDAAKKWEAQEAVGIKYLTERMHKPTTLEQFEEEIESFHEAVAHGQGFASGEEYDEIPQVKAAWPADLHWTVAAMRQRTSVFESLSKALGQYDKQVDHLFDEVQKIIKELNGKYTHYEGKKDIEMPFEMSKARKQDMGHVKFLSKVLSMLVGLVKHKWDLYSALGKTLTTLQHLLIQQAEHEKTARDEHTRRLARALPA